MKNSLLIFFLFISMHPFAQTELTNRKIIVTQYGYSEIYYFYQGDKIRIQYNDINQKPVKVMMMYELKENMTAGIKLFDLTRYSKLDTAVTIPVDGAYAILFKADMADREADYSLTRTAAPGKEDAPINTMENEVVAYTANGGTNYKYSKTLFIPASLEMMQEKESKEMIKKGIDPSTLDKVLYLPINRNSPRKSVIDTTYSAKTGNKPMATIYSDPFWSNNYFKVCKGDTVIINIEAEKKISEINVYNLYHINKLSPVFTRESIDKVSEFAFVAGDNYIYSIEFKNNNLSDTPVKVRVEKISSGEDFNCNTTIIYTTETITVTSENGLLSAKHKRQIPLIE